MPKVTLTIDSNLDNVSLVGVSIHGLCITLTPLAPDAIDDVQLCVVEGINNVIEHSYVNQEGHPIAVIVTLQTDRIMLDIVDTGRGMDDPLREAFNATTPKSPPIEDLPEGGWGLYIIKSKMDEVTYRTNNFTHILRLVKLFRKNCPETILETKTK